MAGTNLVANKIISRKFSSFEKTCPPREVKPPEWNLSLALWSLARPPCELLKLSSDEYLTWRMCFLFFFNRQHITPVPPSLKNLQHRSPGVTENFVGSSSR